MKGKSFFAFSLAVLLIVASSVTTYANIPVRVQLDGVFLDVDAVVVDGRTLAPARAIVEALGGVVDWDGELFQVTINHGNTRILLTIDKPTAYVNGVAVILDVPPQIVAGRTKIPVRFVSETLGLDVGFHYNNFVFLTTIPTEAPQPVIPQPVTSPLTTPQPPINTQSLSDFFDGRSFMNEVITLSDGTQLDVHWTAVVSRNEDAIVRFSWQPGAAFNLSIRYSSGYGTADGLGVQTVNDEGFVSWRWRVGGRTALGNWPITITGNGETINLTLDVIDPQ